MATHVPKRSLILTFDAFGTLIKPRKPISIQYREEAEKFGLKIMTQKEADLEFSFRKGKFSFPWSLSALPICMFHIRIEL